MAKRKKNSVTMADIAESLGVSVVTVSNALNNRGGVSEELSRNVKEAARRLGYSFKLPVEYDYQKKHRIALVVSEVAAASQVQIYLGLWRNTIQKYEVNMVTDVREAEGVIVIGDPLRMAEVIGEKPVVAIAPEAIRTDYHMMIPDQYHGSAILSQELIRRGYRHLCFLETPEFQCIDLDMKLGMQMAAQEAGCLYSSAELPDLPIEEGMAYVAPSNVLAQMLKNRLEEIAVDWNRKLFIACHVGFGEEPGDYLSMIYPWEAMAQRTMKILMRMIEEPEMTFVPKVYTLQGELYDPQRKTDGGTTEVEG